MNVDTDSLRWFQQVAEGITVTEVSELSAVTQPGVSRALRRLEAELGTPLLHRSGRRLQMTQAGEIFKRHVNTLLHQLDDGIAAIGQLIEPDTGTVAVAFQQSLGTWLVPDLVRTFRAARPGVRFQLTQVRDELHSAALDGGQADLEIGTRGPPTRPCTPSGSRSSHCGWPCHAITSSPPSHAFTWPSYPGNRSSACGRPPHCGS